MRTLTIWACALCLSVPALVQTALAQSSGPLRIEINQGVIEPVPIVVPDFIAETPEATQIAQDMARVVANNLSGTGLFREIPKEAYIGRFTDFNAPLQYADWRALNAQGLVAGAVSQNGDQIAVKFRLYDIVTGAELGQGLQLAGTAPAWRRMAHKISDMAYARITGETGYFDTRIVFVSESGPKGDRQKRLAIMDQDGANIRYLTDGSALVLAPRFSPNGDRVLYTSYETGFPKIYLLDTQTGARRVLESGSGTMSFAPRFAPNGQQLVYSLTQAGNTDLYSMDLNTGQSVRLTSSPAIETAPSFSPDGSQIVFESDRSGSQQLYIMPASGGEAKRISFGEGRYGTPVWSPRGDLIAFTKQNKGRFHIGVIRIDGSRERLITASFLDEGPTWAPNGRVLMFHRETQGETGRSSLYSVDISGRNLRPVRTPTGGSDPSWGPLQ